VITSSPTVLISSSILSMPTRMELDSLLALPPPDFAASLLGASAAFGASDAALGASAFEF